MKNKNEEVKPEVSIYSDGACRGNPGPGGWGSILVYKGRERELSGGEELTTNNRMELLGAIRALEALKKPCRVLLVSDSKYLVDGMVLGWAKSWEERSWIKSDRKPALNPDLWERLLRLCEIHDVTFLWIKGHAGHPYNERCDRLATAFADSFKKPRKDPADNAGTQQ